MDALPSRRSAGRGRWQVRFPSIRAVAKELQNINRNVECTAEDGCDVRLCVWADGQWCVRSGDVSYDQSHSDYCGASNVPGVVDGKVQTLDSYAVARDLLGQCKDQHAEDVS